MKSYFKIFGLTALTIALLSGCMIKQTSPQTISGNNSIQKVEAVTTASIVDDAQAVIDGLSSEGVWLVCTLNDIVTDREIVVEGEFHDKGDDSKRIYRKLALCTQDEDHKIIQSFNLTAPKMTVKSENFRIHGGTFIGDVYVEAKGFIVSKETKVEGNIYFASQEIMDSFVLEETGEITGKKELVK